MGYGAGLCDLRTPTNGALMAILATSGLQYQRWVKCAFPLYAGLFALGALAVGTAIVIGLQ